jgi:hypothetical protein
MLGSFCDRADGWFQIQFRSMNVDFFSGMYRTKARNWMTGIGHAQLAAERGRGHASLVVRDVQDFLV